MKYKLMYLLMLCFIVLPMVKASDLIYKSNTEIDLKIPCYNNGTLCSATALCNITVFYPNSSLMINNLQMTNNIAYNNFTLGNLTTEGTYLNSMICNDNGYFGKSSFNFKVTGNGKEDPSGSVIVLFSVLFLAILFYLIIIIMYGIGSIIELDFDIMDLGYNLGGYFAFTGLFMLEQYYLGNTQLETILNILLDIGRWSNFYFPSIAFIIINFFVIPIKKNQQKKKEEMR